MSNEYSATTRKETVADRSVPVASVQGVVKSVAIQGISLYPPCKQRERLPDVDRGFYPILTSWSYS